MSETVVSSKFYVGQVVWLINDGRPTVATVAECDNDDEFVELSNGESSYYPDKCYFTTWDDAWAAIEHEATENVRLSKEYLKKQVDKLAKVRKDRAEFNEHAARLKSLQDAIEEAEAREDNLSHLLDEANAKRAAAEKALAEFKAGM